MKSLIKIVVLAVVVVSSSCVGYRTAGNSGKVPPGQAKKITGKKSARDYAPGQQKKRNKRSVFYHNY